MATQIHGNPSVIWMDNVCVSILQGAFNEQGIDLWFQLVQQSWQQQGCPTHWASVLDMFNWQGRTPECQSLMREGVAWSQAHGLQFRVLLMEGGRDNLFYRLTRTVNPIIPHETDVAVCATHSEVIEELHKHGFGITESQLLSVISTTSI
jgi:hypothetical protein